MCLCIYVCAYVPTSSYILFIIHIAARYFDFLSGYQKKICDIKISSCNF